MTGVHAMNRTFTILCCIAVLGGCSAQQMRDSSTFQENAAGGTYDTYWTPFETAAEYAQQNCRRYGKNAVLTLKDERQATLECR